MQTQKIEIATTRKYEDRSACSLKQRVVLEMLKAKPYAPYKKNTICENCYTLVLQCFRAYTRFQRSDEERQGFEGITFYTFTLWQAIISKTAGRLDCNQVLTTKLRLCLYLHIWLTNHRHVRQKKHGKLALPCIVNTRKSQTVTMSIVKYKTQ